MEDTKEIIAFLGPKASYTHQAALSHFSEDEYAFISRPSIEAVFTAVQTGAVSYGVVPFENSSNGSVIFTLDLFADKHGRFPQTQVDAEIYLRVRHCLLGHPAPYSSSSSADESSSSNHVLQQQQQQRKLDQQQQRQQQQQPLQEEDNISNNISGQATPTQNLPHPQQPHVKPNHDVRHIRKLYSHPQAWGQCRSFLNAYLRAAERQDASSTSRAAEMAAHEGLETAAIASRLAGKLNGLEVLAEGIEDDAGGNSTRFFVLTRSVPMDGNGDGDGASSTNASSTTTGDEEERDPQAYKTLVSFTLEHGEPGALAGCLAVFEKFGLNLTSINTRPSGEAPWHYVFFVEFYGRKRGPRGGAVNDALNELSEAAKSWRWLGSWENKLPR